MRWSEIARAVLAAVVATMSLLGMRSRLRQRSLEAPATSSIRSPEVSNTASRSGAQSVAASPSDSTPLQRGRGQERSLEILGGFAFLIVLIFVLVSVWPELSRDVGFLQALLLLVGTVVLTVFLIVALWQLPKRQLAPRIHDLGPAGQLHAENAARLTLAQIVGGLFLFIGLAFGWRQLRATDETVRLTQEGVQITRDELRTVQEGQITERFTRAVEHLGSDQLEIRLGGIYALERIARDSPRDHGPVFEILTAFIRERTPRVEILDAVGSPPSSASPEVEAPKIPQDIQAILTVVGRRMVASDTPGGCLDLEETNLSGADLRGADLHNVCLTRANLSHSDLQGVSLEEANFSYSILTEALLMDANLVGASFWHADLRGALLSGSQLRGARFNYTDLREASLSNSDLSAAYFDGADLTDASLRDANLEGAGIHSNLQGADLRGANLRGAHFGGADLNEANLEGADLRGADLREAKNLTSSQIGAATTDETTWLPLAL